MNLTCQGAQNALLNGNPDISFFKTTYKRYTNFGKQRFRIDHQGQRTVSMTDPSIFKFRIPRYADMLADTYLVFTLPDIWSPTVAETIPGVTNDPSAPAQSPAVAYKFKWIPNLGTNAIKRVRISAGGVTIQEFTGEYMHTKHVLETPSGKIGSYNRMTGNVPELTDPIAWAPSWAYSSDQGQAAENATNNQSVGSASAYSYPGHWYDSEIPAHYKTVSANFAQPTIASRRVYVPLSAWYSTDIAQALPLVSLQYSEIQIEIELAPFRELWTTSDMDKIINVDSATKKVAINTRQRGDVMRKAPDFNSPYGWFAPRLFLQPTAQAVNRLSSTDPQVPTSRITGPVFLPETSDEIPEWIESNWPVPGDSWDADVHILGEYVFLDDDERNVFAARPQSYLIQDVFQHNHYDISGTERIELTSVRGMVSGWTWFLRRSTAYKTNDWNNYLDTPYTQENSNLLRTFNVTNIVDTTSNELDGPLISANREIMIAWGLIVDGDYREDVRPSEIFNWLEPYECSNSSGVPGLYSYSFGLESGYKTQPTGAMNLAQCSKIEFEVQTRVPPKNPDALLTYICDAAGGVLGIEKGDNDHYTYTYDLKVFEKRYNVLKFENGNLSLMFAR